MSFLHPENHYEFIGYGGIHVSKIRNHTRTILFIAFVVLLLACALFFARPPVKAAGDQFTLGPIPTVNHEVAFDGTSTSNVTTAAEFITAYSNPAISRIILDSDISFTNAEAFSVYSATLDHDLLIEGNGNLISFDGFSGFSAFFNVSTLSAAPRTFHLKNVEVSKLTSANLDIFVNGGNAQWDYIFDDLTIDAGVKFAFIMVNATNVDLFFRNSVSAHMYDQNFAKGIGHAIFESNSQVTIGKPADGFAVFWDDSLPYDSVAYFADNSAVDIEGSNGYPVFYPWYRLDAYPNSNVYMHKVLDGEGVMDAFGVNQVIRIDRDATFNLTNSSGPAYYDQGQAVSILSNPGANIHLIGNYAAAGGAIVYANGSSQMILNSPDYYDLRNNSNAFAALRNSSLNSTSEMFQIVDTNLAAWTLASNLAGIPTAPSPFLNVSLSTNNAGLLGSSSPILDTMAGGWNTANYARISYATVPVLTVSDKTTMIGTSVSLGATATPATATLTYTSLDPTIATVDASGNVTGLTVGTARITVTATSIENVPVSQTVNVVITPNTPPTITHPGFTEISLGTSFDPLVGVTANDAEDGSLTSEVSVSSGSVDINTAGIYVLTYSVTDSDSNTTTSNRTILVNDGTFTAGTTYIMRAQNFSLRVGEVSTTTPAIVSRSQATVYSKTTGLVDATAVQVDNLGGYTQTAGTYNIVLSVTGDSGASRTVTATVVTGSLPTISGATFAEVALNGSFDPRSGVTASDTEDGDLTLAIDITGSVNTATAGIYVLTYSVEDSDLNTVTQTRTVLVNDGTFTAGSTYILKASDFTLRVSQVNTGAAAIIGASAAKTYSIATGAEVTPGIIIDNLGGYTAAVGAYNITMSVTGDSSASRTIAATVVAGNTPNLTVPGFTEIAVDASFDPRSGATASDIEDGNITANITIAGTVDTAMGGIYKLTYSITDSDFNSASIDRIILVNDGTFAAGNLFILKATNFATIVDYVDTSDAAVKTAAQIQVFDKATGLPTAEAVQIDDLGGYNATIGSYQVIFSITTDLPATRTVTARVMAGTPPVIEAPAFTEVKVGGTFDPLAGVTAADSEDGSLTARISVSGTVNTAIAGIYKLVYSVTDDVNNTASVNRIVLINDGSFSAGSQYILEAFSFSRRVSDVDTTSAGVIDAAQAVVYDKSTGNIVSKSILVSDLGGYSPTPGVYVITLQVEGDPLAASKIEATVIAGLPPVITAPSFTEIKLGASFDSKKDVKAEDAEEGDLSAQIKVTGTVDSTKADIYVLTYSVTDSDLNVATFDRVILVNDGSFAASDNYIIKAEDFRLGKSKANLSDKDMIALGKVTVYSIIDQAYVENPEIKVDRSAYRTSIGVSDITFSFNPSITVKVTVYQDYVVPKTGMKEDYTALAGSILLLMAAVATLGVRQRREKSAKE